MPKVKLPRKSTLIDMTAMCDVAFLLLTFFMLTTKFKADDPVIVDTPSSISEIKLPDTDILNITIEKDGKIFFGIDGKYNRERLIDKIGAEYNIQFSEEEKYAFSLQGSIGMPIAALKKFLQLPPNEMQSFQQPGIPCDSTVTLTNELSRWIMNARLTNPRFRVAIRGDINVPYPVIKRVIGTLQDKNVNKFNLVTDLEAKPK